MKKILIVDDELALRLLVRETLELYDYEVYEGKDGGEALDLVCELNPDLVILDVMMPKVSGYEALTNIRKTKLLKQPKILMLSAKNQDIDAVYGADGFITKPFSPMKLAEIVENILK